ncbi:MAG: hypothetical protein NTY88_07120 [Bacteroidetes bacterium]|nr:hypothetical protein [Bacteroidota bacterium]
MTVFDFVTDHLVDVDFIFDQHENEDEQKPHTPIQFQHLQLQTFFWQPTIALSLAKPAVIKTSQASFPRRLIPSEYISKIFRPPIV